MAKQCFLGVLKVVFLITIFSCSERSEPDFMSECLAERFEVAHIVSESKKVEKYLLGHGFLNDSTFFAYQTLLFNVESDSLFAENLSQNFEKSPGILNLNEFFSLFSCCLTDEKVQQTSPALCDVLVKAEKDGQLSIKMMGKYLDGVGEAKFEGGVVYRGIFLNCLFYLVSGTDE